MATHGWRKSASLEEWLFDEGRRFDFFQAVALLEARAGAPAGVGEGSEPQEEAVRFKSTIALAFAETDVASIQRPLSPGEPAEMTVNFIGLGGALGPLPLPFAEIVLQRAVRGDTALRDFLDIFNHRLVSLIYRARKQHRLSLGVRSPEQGDAARYLFALLGLGSPALRGRLGMPDRALLHHAGLFSRPVRSVVGLETILRHHFGVPVEVRPLTGRYCPLERHDWTTIGRLGRNHRLGESAVLGTRVWDQEAAFDLRVGPVAFETFLRFLPGGDALGPLCTLTRFYAGEVQDFRVRLVLRAAAVRPARLGATHGARLGVTAWLGSAAGPPAPTSRASRPRSGSKDPEIVLEGALLAAARSGDPRSGAAWSVYPRPIPVEKTG